MSFQQFLQETSLARWANEVDNSLAWLQSLLALGYRSDTQLKILEKISRQKTLLNQQIKFPQPHSRLHPNQSKCASLDTPLISEVRSLKKNNTRTQMNHLIFFSQKMRSYLHFGFWTSIL